MASTSDVVKPTLVNQVNSTPNMNKKTSSVAPATTLTEEQLARLKAQSEPAAAGGIKLPVVNRVSLNGNADAVEDEKGNLVRPPISYRKQIFVGKEADQKPETVDLGAPIEVIFVKSRRRLVARDSQGFQTMSTSQHTHPNQTVTLWQDGKMVDKGHAKDLREKYEDLRTVQETYVLLPDGELAMLICKGAALGSKTRDEKLPTFYQYLQSLKEDGIFAHKTILGGVLEKGAKNFYTMTFEKGRPTTAEEQLAVLEHSDKLTALINEYDEQNANSVVSTETASPETDTVEDEEAF
jgi:hypothetical protein